MTVTLADGIMFFNRVILSLYRVKQLPKRDLLVRCTHDMGARSFYAQMIAHMILPITKAQCNTVLNSDAGLRDCPQQVRRVKCRTIFPRK